VEILVSDRVGELAVRFAAESSSFASRFLLLLVLIVSFNESVET